MWAPGITELVYSELLGTGPAVVDRLTGIVYLNPLTWPLLPEFARVFILLHEQGHLAEKTTDEGQADAYAYSQFVAQGYAPEQAALAITSTFPDWQYSVELRNRVTTLQQLAIQHGQRKQTIFAFMRASRRK